jgi:hypothetical protein
MNGIIIEQEQLRMTEIARKMERLLHATRGQHNW